MIWIITKRGVLKKIHKMRWQRDPSLNSRTMTSWENYEYGVPSQDLDGRIFFNEMSQEIKDSKMVDLVLFYLGKISSHHKNYIEKLMPRIKQAVRVLEDDGYIKKVSGCFVLTGKGEDWIRWWYYPKKIFTNRIVEAVIIGVIMIFITNYITNNIINKVSNAVISTQHKTQQGQAP
jgi:hypothetical protein